MELQSFGAARRVTGSKHIISLSGGKRILLDCGLFQGEGEATPELNHHFHFDPTRIDVMILSHAHIDHCGLIPKLVKEGYKGKIYCTHATKELVKAMLLDSAEIQEEDFEHLSKEGQARHPLLYNVEDAKRCFGHFYSIDYDRPFVIDEELTLTFTDAGHIVGSAVCNMEIKENGQTKRVAFTGDIGRYNVRIIRDPQPFPQADVIIMESTYGNELHQSRDFADEALEKAILDTCVKKEGKLIIPAFSLGRTQDFIYLLNKLYNEAKIPAIPVFIDSPLSHELTGIVSKHKEVFDEETLAFMKHVPEIFAYPELRFTKNIEESKRLNFIHIPCIIIAASGMLEGGRIRHHLIHGIEDRRNTILLNSYMPPQSLGAALKRGDKVVKIWDNDYEVYADIIDLNGLSAHADRDELLRFLECQDKHAVQSIHLVHGEDEQQIPFQATLLNAGFAKVNIMQQN